MTKINTQDRLIHINSYLLSRVAKGIYSLGNMVMYIHLNNLIARECSQIDNTH